MRYARAFGDKEVSARLVVEDNHPNLAAIIRVYLSDKHVCIETLGLVDALPQLFLPIVFYRQGPLPNS